MVIVPEDKSVMLIPYLTSSPGRKLTGEVFILALKGSSESGTIKISEVGSIFKVGVEDGVGFGDVTSSEQAIAPNIIVVTKNKTVNSFIVITLGP